MAGTTPVLFARSFLFLFRRFCLEHVRTVRLTNDFWHHLKLKKKKKKKEEVARPFFLGQSALFLIIKYNVCDDGHDLLAL